MMLWQDTWLGDNNQATIEIESQEQRDVESSAPN